MSTLSRRDKWIPWYFVAFFAVLIVVDGTMAALAIHTQTGLVTEHAYEQGLEYNQVVQEADAQAALGWKSDITYQVPGHVLFRIKDKQGNPLTMKEVTAEMWRPTQAVMDFTTKLTSVAAGEYRAEVHFPKQGLWEIRIFATTEDNRRYQQSKRIVIE